MKLGFLGAGAMGGAILKGAVNSGVLAAKDIYVYDVIEELNEKYKAIGCNVASEVKELGESVDMLVSAVKPQQAGRLNGWQSYDLHHGRTDNKEHQGDDGRRFQAAQAHAQHTGSGKRRGLCS